MSVRIVTTVTTPATNYDLVSLAVVREELGVSGNGSDTQIARYISAASAAVVNYCNRVFTKETLTDIFNLSRARLQWGSEDLLQTSRYPVISVASVVEDSTTLVAGTDYEIDVRTGQLLRLGANSGQVTFWGISPVTIVYDGGYNPIPLDLQDAVTRMIRSRWFAKSRDPMVREINVPGVLEQQFWVPTGTDAGNMTPDVTDILDNYRAVTIA